ncbi:MAG: hypothetical protein RLZZ399_1276 [Verrucomicrobiota bacterium]
MRSFRSCGLLGVALTTAVEAFAEDGGARIAKLEKENDLLKSRLESIEATLKSKGVPAPKAPPSFTVAASSPISLSGFVQGSYFHDLSNPPTSYSPGYLWNEPGNASLNRFKVVLSTPPVKRSGDDFSAAFRGSLMFGNDAQFLNTVPNGYGNVREGFIELNVPVGTGLNVRAGQLISLLNYESGDGGAANDNFSQGLQWWFTGSGPQTGLQLSYNVTEKIEVKGRLQNQIWGVGALDPDDDKLFLGSVNFKPTSDTWINFLGFTGRQGAAAHMYGGSILAGSQLTPNFHAGTELDLWNLRSSAKNSQAYSTGLWLSYKVTDTFKPALRVDYLSDGTGAFTSGGGMPFFPINSSRDVTGVTLTFNYNPLPNVKIQPEIRYDHSSVGRDFGSTADRIIVGAGITYSF